MWLRTSVIVLLFVFGCGETEQDSAPSSAKPAESPSAVQKQGAAAQRPTGIVVDAARWRVSVPAVVAEQAVHARLGGAIEFVLVAEGGKTYETLFITPHAPAEIHAALGRIGLRRGWAADGDRPPRGPVVWLSVVRHGADGTAREQPVAAFLEHLESGEPVAAAPWVYTGSSEVNDPATGRTVLQASLSRTIVGLHVSDASALVQNARPQRVTENTYRARGAALPPPGTDVRIIFERRFPEVADGVVRVRAFVSGRVQGVGFRRFTQRAARELHLSGWVCNLADGRVELVAEGPAEQVDALLDAVRRGPRAARVEAVDVHRQPPQAPAERYEVRYR